MTFSKGKITLAIKLDEKARGRAEPILEALYAAFPSRTPVSVIINKQVVSLHEVYQKAQDQNPVPYQINFRGWDFPSLPVPLWQTPFDHPVSP